MIEVIYLEDDSLFAETIVDFLSFYNIQTTVAPNADIFLEAIYMKRFDLYILDINLPKTSGLDVLNLLKDDDFTPKIILSSFPNYLLQSFKLGAVDFIRKVVDPEEILLRIENAIKKQYNTYQNILSLDDRFAFDVIHKQLIKSQEPLNLTNLQSKILACLLRFRNTPVGLNEIEQYVYPACTNNKTEAIRFHMAELRKIFEHQYIHSYYKKGYSFYKLIEN